MTLRHLEIFLEVRRLKSITKAADSLNLAQPAVSRVIHELESFYGIRLFERMNRKLYITEAGEQLFLYADSIINQFYEAKDVLQDRTLTANIRIGSNSTCGQQLLPMLLQKFKKSHPEIHVYLKISNSQEIEEALLRNELDFGFIDVPHKPEYFLSQKIAEDELMLICAEDYPVSEKITFEQLEKLPLLVREAGSGSRQLLEQLFAQERSTPKIIMESSNVFSLLQMCHIGFGILVLTKNMAGSWLDLYPYKKIQLQETFAKRTYYLVFHKSKYLTRSMKCFQEFTKELLKNC